MLPEAPALPRPPPPCLQFADFLLSFLAVILTCLALAPLPPSATAAVQLSAALLLAVLAKDNATRQPPPHSAPPHLIKPATTLPSPALAFFVASCSPILVY